MKYSEYVYSKILQMNGLKRIIHKAIFKVLKFYFYSIDKYFDSAKINNTINKSQLMTKETFDVFADIIDKRKKTQEEKKN